VIIFITLIAFVNKLVYGIISCFFCAANLLLVAYFSLSMCATCFYLLIRTCCLN